MERKIVYEPKVMELMTVKEVKEALQESKSVIIPVGCLEQQGYHLPLKTDTIIAYEISKVISAQTGCFVAAPIPYSFSGGTLFGTIDVTPQVFSLLLYDICNSLCNQGFVNIMVLLGHQGTENNKATFDSADMFMRRSAHKDRVSVAVVPLFELSPSILKEVEQGDFHAGFVATSLMLYLFPELVRPEIIMDSPKVVQMIRADQNAFQIRLKQKNNKFVYPQIKQHPDIAIGVMGYPEKANKGFGEVIFNELITNGVEVIKQLEENI
jgi:creatinine amidohydrolase